MTDGAPETDMAALLSALRAAGEATRLRLLFILARGEFNVSELVRILGQSQPRLSRHLKLMTDAGLLERTREGSWVLFRAREDGPMAGLVGAVLALKPADDAQLAADLAAAEEVRRERAAAAEAYFAKVAREWDSIRALHVAEEEVEAAMRRLAGEGPFRFYLDLGTGTGRILELFAARAERALGIDASRAMLGLARARLERAGLRPAQVRLADIYDLPLEDGRADFATIHQVLHFLDDPAAALREVGRVLAPGGRVLIADFAPHELEFLREDYAHRRLGIDGALMRRWLRQAGLTVRAEEVLPPPERNGAAGLTVALWLARKE